MEPRLDLHHAQKQILSPQIRQYLKLLQMPLAELCQAVDTELAENPLLEEGAKAGPEESLPESENASLSQERTTEELDFGESFKNLEKIDESYQDDFDRADLAQPATGELQKSHEFQQSLITKPETLFDFLHWQIRFLNLEAHETKLAEEIIGNIDEEGYLRASLEEISKASGQSMADVEKILALIQQLDPPGIGARNLQEALLLQLGKKNMVTSLAATIVREYLPLLEKRDWRELSKVLSVSPDEIRSASEIIIHLEPKPGRTFYLEEPIAVTPDATVYAQENSPGKYKIEIHDETIPELRINAYYRKLLRKKTTDEKTKIFLREKLQNALNFLKALQLRKSTLRLITEEIVKVQSLFFEKGFSNLVPLRLKDIAGRIGMHESTVSRAVQGKYISTPQGTIAYKSFFSTKLETVSGELESQKSMMEKIRRLVENENPQKPLSDQDIVGILQADGVKIARRTIAKYRDLLKILPSHLRRKR